MFQKIKKECPETIFCGTDVGHQYATSGERYLAYLREHGQNDSADYRRAQEIMKQGKTFYQKMKKMKPMPGLIEKTRWLKILYGHLNN
nr:hypothetical protein [uncultured Sellimonas sp.]